MSVNTQKAETTVGEAITSLLANPASLRQDLRAMIEREHKTYGDPCCIRICMSKNWCCYR
jgi:hypothetical protein